ncbi:MAG: VWA domain-containing protein [Pirellulaceae bacterium]|nr:VWA domain-containing protein [Pirellulaceae bacterium]
MSGWQRLRRVAFLWASLGASLGWLAMVGCDGSSRSGGVPMAFDSMSPETLPDTANLNTEAYADVPENRFVKTLNQPQSTFAIDVDTASYANVRRMLNDAQLPPKGAVRLEELVNYFQYTYPEPDVEHPFSVDLKIADCPWQAGHQLVRVGLRARAMSQPERAHGNLVFLIDVSGSMQDGNKLPLVKSAMKMLVSQLGQQDRLAIVVYAGQSGVVLPSTTARDAPAIMSAIDQLGAGGSTNGAAGIREAYAIAEQHFVSSGINRVILCTDGDFNVGVTSESELVDLITQQAKSNIFLTVLGFGSGNYKDATMEKLADKGNGNYAYIDTPLEARKVLVEQLGATLATVAKDVKIQVDFNPQLVSAYRLLGYENRVMANQEFRNDAQDAGEIGAGHTVTAFYEIVPAGQSRDSSPVFDTPPARPSEFVTSRLTNDHETLLTVNLRYKPPTGSVAAEFQRRLTTGHKMDGVDEDFRFATAVLACGMLLRKSEFAGSANWDWVVQSAQENAGEDRHGWRAEFVQLAKTARRLNQ